METARLRKYSGISLAIVLMTAFVLAQPIMNQSYAVGLEELPSYDDCDLSRITEVGFFDTVAPSRQPEDPISMNTVRSGNIVKTIHAEKEIFNCELDQGGLFVIVDVTTYIELYEKIDSREVITSNAVSITCVKDQFMAVVIDCESKPILSTPVPVGADCRELNYITHPQEMNTVNKGATAKTIEAQKEVFICPLGEPHLPDLQPEINRDGCFVADSNERDPFQCFPTLKKVEIILFTDIYEDLSAQTVEEVQFHSMRCVVLITNDHFNEDPEDDVQDATVESCKLSTIEN